MAELGINEGGNPVDRAPPTPGQIKAFEEYFDVRLPFEYLTLLCTANGGHPEIDLIKPMGRDDLAARNVDHFYHLNEDIEHTSNLWNAAVAWRKILGAGYLPFACDGGGNPFLLQIDADPPAVVACIHDEDLAIVAIAPDFEQFIDGLELDPDLI